MTKKKQSGKVQEEVKQPKFNRIFKKTEDYTSPSMKHHLTYQIEDDSAITIGLIQQLHPNYKMESPTSNHDRSEIKVRLSAPVAHNGLKEELKS